MAWNEVPEHDHDESILNDVTFFGALSLNLTVNLSPSVSDVASSSRKPICSEFQAPFTSQLLPSGVALHSFDNLISSSSSRI